MTPADIIARLERATGASDLLDAEIYATIGGCPHATKAGSRTVPFIAKGDPRTYPAYTASLDAAIALVEKQGFLWLRKSFNSMTVTRPLTEEQDARKEWAKHFDAAGATPTIALLIALFKALASEDRT